MTGFRLALAFAGICTFVGVWTVLTAGMSDEARPYAYAALGGLALAHWASRAG